MVIDLLLERKGSVIIIYFCSKQLKNEPFFFLQKLIYLHLIYTLVGNNAKEMDPEMSRASNWPLLINFIL